MVSRMILKVLMYKTTTYSGLTLTFREFICWVY